MARRERSNRGYLLIALVIAVLLWAVAQGSTSVERSYDLPVVFQNVPEALVITDQNSDVVNVRVQGSRAGLRNVEQERLEYVVVVDGAQPGQADFDIPQQPIDLPRGAKVVSRSPSQLEVKFERKMTKAMRVRADVAGEPAPGYRVAGVAVDPPRVTVSGARREVMRLNEAVTEPVDVAGAQGPVEREVRIGLGGQNVWVQEPAAVRVRVDVQPVDAADAQGAAEQG